ncbi:prolyl-tRNA synthetase [Candidatus Nomurabacteria bacterium]|nr:prolyl-tRNA synthetase [Candidatus Nomurabacteria bacterium]USN94841.1 MAG: prolyl-tRNA synthetase [Candidatus Nomurabacteria bacterium]
MRQSKLFTKTRKEAPADEVAENAKMLIRAGFVHKEMSGVYSFLPLGLRVIENISSIIREEMNKVGGVEMKSAALQRKEVWEKTRWSDEVVDNWFKTELKNGTELGLAFTHEEPLTAMMKNYISSYKDLPVYPYDIMTVFRNEARAKSGIMRGREFFWKALYSFSKDKEEHDAFYEKIKDSYTNIFNRVGIGESTFLTFASGGSFSKYSHEFQTLSSAGEDTVYIDKDKKIAINKEVYTDEVISDLGLDKNNLLEEKAIEVGNIFSLGDKFSEPLELTYKGENGEPQNVFMGSYGIGISRLMGVVVETNKDDKGIIWPKEITPFKAHLLVIGEDQNVKDAGESLYLELKASGIETLFDDRDGVSPGEKLGGADLVGIPVRIVVSKKSLDAGGYEFKERNSDNSMVLSNTELIDTISEIYKKHDQ